MHKVLAILDSEDFSLALRDALQSDCEVIICDIATGPEKLKLQPDILVIDLLLPGIDGLSFLEQIGRSRPKRVLMLTTLITDAILQAASDLGVDYMVRKPCTISTVANYILRHKT